MVHLYEVISTEQHLFIVLELVDGGKLFDKIETSTTRRLTAAEAREYFQQLTYALAFCHNTGISHKNLKPENLLLRADGRLKISYFGLSALSQEVGRDGMVCSSIPCGAPQYRAPEMEALTGYEGARADIWSSGVILYYMLAGYLPFNSDNIRITYLKTCVADFTCPSFFSPSLKRLIKRILDPNPATRITVDAIFRDEWFNGDTVDHPPPLLDPVAAEGQDAGSTIHEIKNSYDNTRIPSIFRCEPLLRLINVLALRERRFVAKFCKSEIISALEKSLRSMGLRVKNVKLEIQGRVGPEQKTLSIYTKIYRVSSPPFHLVEIWKTGGDARDFDKFYAELCDGMKEIIWDEGSDG
ncbi:unnamed protein product [Sphenostylis stenocarpa]|uniref:Protein kinase domain-containing protein n=1 Tax=Sphenostylis stenocarpa TaxID=92480 RepID=A0AA86SNB1_9FABA|nr:unnamed protein product [Sphenostylis stenocarpa]